MLWQQGCMIYIPQWWERCCCLPHPKGNADKTANSSNPKGWCFQKFHLKSASNSLWTDWRSDQPRATWNHSSHACAAACSCLLALDVVKPSTQTLLSHLPTRPPLQQEHLHLLCFWCRSLGLGASTPVWSNLWKRWFECTSTAWYQGCCAVILMQWAKRCPTANTPRVHDT